MSSESGLVTKQERLQSLSTENGIIAALAIDQRKSLRRLMAEAAGLPSDQIPDERLITFKSAVSPSRSS